MSSPLPAMAPVSGSSLSRLGGAFLKGCWSQLKPAMLSLLLWPFLVALIFWVLSALLFWDPMVLWFKESWLLSSRFMAWLSDGAQAMGISDLNGGIARLVTILLLLPVVIASGMVVIAVFAMPLVMRHLSNNHYPNVVRSGSFSLWANLANALSSLGLFVIGYLLCLPLWLIPPLALVIPWLWWGWLTARIMRFDSLVEHASPDERKLLISRHNREYLGLGLMVAALNYIPPLFLITPVLSALVFGHYSLSRLAELRARQS